VGYPEIGKSNSYYYGVDLIRFICATMVMLFHLGFASWASPTVHLAGFKIQSLDKFAQPGWVGVEVFFVISGFVVAGAAMAATPSSFVKGRILRLYPAVWVCASFTFLVCLLNGGPIRHLLEAYTMSLVLSPTGPWIDGQYWTLATEIAFYFLIFLLIVSKTIARIQVFAMVLALLSMALVAALQVYPGAAPLVKLSNVRWLPVYNGADFALGIFIWLWSKGTLNRLTVFGLIVAIATGSLQIYQGNLSDTARAFPATGYHFNPLVPTFIWIFGSGLIVLSIVYKRHFDNLPSRIRSWIRTLGLMTYPVYLLHYAIGVAGMRIMIHRGVNPVVAMLIMMVMISALAFGVCTCLEPLLKAWLRPRLDRLETRFGWNLRPSEAGAP
jgi:exopolysaccharide production protein ExoZ